MFTKKQTKKYIDIVSDILDNEEFCNLKNIIHHNTTRYDHSVRVSYYSYKIAKLLRLDYEATARAGLLHDFFLDTYNKTNKASLMLDHPSIAVSNSLKYFNLTDKEIDMIKCHMFPVNPTLPKYAESWIVCIADDAAAIKEKFCSFRFKMAYVMNFYLIFLVNFMK